MDQVLVEVLPNIQACNMYITLPAGAGDCENMTNNKMDCILKCENGNEMQLTLPRGTCLVPNSVAKMTQDAGIITLRLQIDERASLIGALSDDILGSTGMCYTTAELTNTMTNTVISAQCKWCEKCVYENVQFRRVLPLPSVDWDQASEGWFCHLHTDDKQKLKPASLQPGHDECFYTELFFLVDPLNLGGMSVECDGHSITCSQCKVSVGMKTAQSLKLWAHNLKWVKQSGDTVFSRSTNEIILSLFQNIDRDNCGVNCQLVLETSTMPKKYLYMVTMNTNQKLFISNVMQTNIDKTHPCESNGQTELSESGPPNYKRLRVEDKREVCLKKIYAVKVLYLLKEDEDSQTGAWVDDVNVHIIPCSDSFLQEVHALLQNFSCCLPDSIRIVGDMCLGYIIK